MRGAKAGGVTLPAAATVAPPPLPAEADAAGGGAAGEAGSPGAGDSSRSRLCGPPAAGGTPPTARDAANGGADAASVGSGLRGGERGARGDGDRGRLHAPPNAMAALAGTPTAVAGCAGAPSPNALLGAVTAAAPTPPQPRPSPPVAAAASRDRRCNVAAAGSTARAARSSWSCASPTATQAADAAPIVDADVERSCTERDTGDRGESAKGWHGPACKEKKTHTQRKKRGQHGDRGELGERGEKGRDKDRENRYGGVGVRARLPSPRGGHGPPPVATAQAVWGSGREARASAGQQWCAAPPPRGRYGPAHVAALPDTGQRPVRAKRERKNRGATKRKPTA